MVQCLKTGELESRELGVGGSAHHYSLKFRWTLPKAQRHKWPRKDESHKKRHQVSSGDWLKRTDSIDVAIRHQTTLDKFLKKKSSRGNLFNSTSEDFDVAHPEPYFQKPNAMECPVMEKEPTPRTQRMSETNVPSGGNIPAVCEASFDSFHPEVLPSVDIAELIPQDETPSGMKSSRKPEVLCKISCAENMFRAEDTKYSMSENSSQLNLPLLNEEVKPARKQVKIYRPVALNLSSCDVRKVYGILMTQLLVTVAFICLFLYSEGARLYSQQHPELYIIALVMLFACMIALACCEGVRRKSPHNFIVLGIFTLLEGFMLGTVTAHFQKDEVLMAVGITTVVCLGLTMFAFQTKYDFTGWGAGLFVCLLVLLVFGIVAIFIPGRVVSLIYSSLGAMLFSLYLVYDTQLMMGGNHKYAISPEEYIFAALNLYLDIGFYFMGNRSAIMSSPVVISAGAKHTATLIFMHGLGDTGHSWASVLATVRPSHVKIICPHAPEMPVTLNAGFRMPSWFDLKTLDPKGPEDEEGINRARATLRDIIAEEEKNGISSERIAIGGFSQGGALAMYTGLTTPKKLAGLICLSCWIPLHKKFPAALAKEQKDTAIFQAHGESDFTVPYQWGMQSKSHLENHVKDWTFKSYPNLGHSSSDKEMSDLKTFLDKILPPV
ncbi:unnamed protein product [Notodromas monacha]|uniref:palmitoyl-protein hydrolase n=1 Tax=Notodromas monacha TaxID=399045 RepID=A0A7R9BHC5_9CRUS|nr:unnamed protein product [Notodromas monacha]CAG0914461.1 unnamed protein product [Notodromas monacha]